MFALPIALGLGTALLLCPLVLAALRRSGLTRSNHRGDELPHPTGLVILLSGALAGTAVGLVENVAPAGALPGPAPLAATFVVGVGALGLVDDLAGDRLAGAPRGVRSHAAAVARGHLSTGVLKAAGTAALAVLVASEHTVSPAEQALAAALLVLSAHAFNLLDVRPGRSIKVFALLAGALTLLSMTDPPLWELGVFVGPVLALLPLDLRRRGMLGDTGAGAIGAVAGLWIVLTLSTLGQALTLVALAGVAVYGELRSITALVERAPLLRQLDSLGRA